jgi:selenocysteine-specific elongation factor
MRVIGTAGHVDHGKSTLVQRLTGIQPDRLKEEQARKLTIDLGFAWFDLPDDVTVGIVDVPGHRDFIENMLAGIGGIDAALLVIAADEGVMPQTREHLAILDLLGIEQALVVLTKIDLIDDDEWLDLVELDVQALIAESTIADAPILRVSAQTGAGIDALLQALMSLLAGLPAHTDYNQPRLPVDRVFTVEGFGTVVTGTLSGGTLSVGDAIAIQPADIAGRVRGLQSYKQTIETALPGSRVAVNISGVDTTDIDRGHVIAYPGQLQSTRLIDVHFRHLADIDRPLKHNSEVKFFSGASETMARVRLLDSEALAPDTQGWLQLRLRDAIPLTHRDRFILRDPSPARTIGGGVIVNAHPDRRWKRFQAAVLDDLATRLRGSPAERLVQVADAEIPVKRTLLQQQTGYTDAELDDALQSALDQHQLVEIDGAYLATNRYQALQHQLEQILRDYHADSPLRLGMPRAELQSRLGVKQGLLQALLTTASVVVENHLLRLPDHRITFTPQQRQQIETLRNLLAQTPYAPPAYVELTQVVSEDALYALVDLGELVQVEPEMLFLKSAYTEIVARILAVIDQHGEIDVKGVRDMLGSSRKYAIALLEHLDREGITRRVGDVRQRGQRR